MILNQVQLEVLRHLAEGRSNRQIASAMCYSQQSVKRHVSIIMKKLKADSRTHAVALAIRQGLIDVPGTAASGGEMHVRHAHGTRGDTPRHGDSYPELTREIGLLREQVAILADLLAEMFKAPRNMTSYRLPPRRLRRPLNLN